VRLRFDLLYIFSSSDEGLLQYCRRCWRLGKPICDYGEKWRVDVLQMLRAREEFILHFKASGLA
jgi:hypothetical protein